MFEHESVTDLAEKYATARAQTDRALQNVLILHWIARWQQDIRPEAERELREIMERA